MFYGGNNTYRFIGVASLATATFLGLHFITSKELSQKLLGGFLLLGFIFDLADVALLYLVYDLPIEFVPNTAFIYFPFLYFWQYGLLHLW